MKRLIAAALLSLTAAPVLADVGPTFLPDLTFPAPITRPDISSQGCVLTEAVKPCH